MKNYYNHKVKIPVSAFPWTVGHRLKRSRKTLPYKQARKYYKSLAHCKTRFISQEIPLSILLTRTMSARAKQLVASITDHNPFLAKLREAGAKSTTWGHVITEPVKLGEK